MTIKNLTLASITTLALGISGCQNAPEKNSQSEDYKTLIAKIDALDKKVDRLQGGAGKARQPRKRPTVGQLYKVGVAGDDAYRGGKDAKVTIAIASEFACPYCKLLADATDSLIEQYKEDELKVVSKQFVVHPTIATEPALAACAAGRQGNYAKYENALWDGAWEDGDKGPRLVREALSKESLDDIAGKLSLDMDRFHSDMKGACKQTIARHQREMRTLGVNGTPAVYINGRYYGGPRTADALKEAVDKALAAANTQLASGGSLEGYYDRLIAKGKPTL